MGSSGQSCRNQRSGTGETSQRIRFHNCSYGTLSGLGIGADVSVFKADVEQEIVRPGRRTLALVSPTLQANILRAMLFAIASEQSRLRGFLGERAISVHPCAGREHTKEGGIQKNIHGSLLRGQGTLPVAN